MIKLKIPNKIRLSLYTALFISLVTGVTFFIMNTWVYVEGDFGPEKHPWQFSVLKTHAFSAFFIMLFYGAMWATHVQYGWRSKLSRRTGIAIVSVLGLQIISAYLLYYMANEGMRDITRYIHLGVGLSIPLVLYVHILIARRRYQKK